MADVLTNLDQMFERTINCTIAKDNGRAPEFIRRKEYKDKSKCYECGVSTKKNRFYSIDEGDASAVPL